MQFDRLILDILDETLSLQGRAHSYTRDTPLLGYVPELDSMAVVSLLGAFEDTLNIEIDYGEINADNFATVGSLTDFLGSKIREA
ncbi:acyl carrier protein [Pseudorhodoferax sp. Leaf267]|uniref:acyl carrier protein n=1 Tax=Pseudorhodoferax sp. Leaf267 TaxID=1736316 RepID=UPI0006F9B4A0|nr:acyl carrier protein [Pseudorhodoferax sp. Leaf267]KQP23140.1 acyl carrier protein [Pseudorhodoferax sp. Leaf267]